MIDKLSNYVFQFRSTIPDGFSSSELIIRADCCSEVNGIHGNRTLVYQSEFKVIGYQRDSAGSRC